MIVGKISNMLSAITPNKIEGSPRIASNLNALQADSFVSSKSQDAKELAAMDVSFGRKKGQASRKSSDFYKPENDPSRPWTMAVPETYRSVHQIESMLALETDKIMASNMAAAKGCDFDIVIAGLERLYIALRKKKVEFAQTYSSISEDYYRDPSVSRPADEKEKVNKKWIIKLPETDVTAEEIKSLLALKPNDMSLFTAIDKACVIDDTSIGIRKLNSRLSKKFEEVKARYKELSGDTYDSKSLERETEKAIAAQIKASGG